jgi:hypothetical protein
LAAARRHLRSTSAFAPQAGEEAEQAKQAAAKARAQQQKEVQLQQLEELKSRIRKERCAAVRGG